MDSAIYICRMSNQPNKGDEMTIKYKTRSGKTNTTADMSIRDGRAYREMLIKDGYKVISISHNGMNYTVVA